ncbi:GNAT family N-acetyltransferase [Consotaella aegiceratis]|uniref:GNAT family N-acetyltransferase n=1 Tax=Consotaella aegiceratis TaxID=3097961 RepID=UPI002F3F6D18
MDAAAVVHRTAFDGRLPWLSGLHTAEDDRAFFRHVVFAECALWGAFDDGQLAGFIAFRTGWIEQLYVLPAMQGCGIGRKLLQIAQDASSELSLWTFQKNAGARRFYETNGFEAAETTDGSGNEEREPDIRYVWLKGESGGQT